MIVDPLFYVAAIPAVILVGLAKGGFAGLGLLSLPLLALVAPPLQAASIMMPILIVQDIVSVRAYWRQWDNRTIAMMLPGAMLGILLAYLLAAWVSEAAFEIALGLISIVFGLRNLIGPRAREATQPNALAASWWGMATGFTSAIAHAGGPPFQIYMLPQRMPRDLFVATGVLFFGLLNVAKVAPFTALGGFTEENLWTSAVLLPLAIASTMAGVALVRRVSAERFYRIIYLLLVAVGLQLVWRGVGTLM
jgi:uncharacterized membrane protein YfcA